MPKRARPNNKSSTRDERLAKKQIIDKNSKKFSDPVKRTFSTGVISVEKSVRKSESTTFETESSAQQSETSEIPSHKSDSKSSKIPSQKPKTSKIPPQKYSPENSDSESPWDSDDEPSKAVIPYDYDSDDTAVQKDRARKEAVEAADYDGTEFHGWTQAEIDSYLLHEDL